MCIIKIVCCTLVISAVVKFLKLVSFSHLIAERFKILLNHCAAVSLEHLDLVWFISRKKHIATQAPERELILKSFIYLQREESFLHGQT